MAAFSTNQTRQFYFISGHADVAPNTNPYDVLKAANIGTYHIHKTPKGDVYLQVKGHGGVTRTDIIRKGCVNTLTITEARKMRYRFRKCIIDFTKLDQDAVDKLKGEVLGLRTDFFGFAGVSEEDTKHLFADIAVNSTDDPEDVVAKSAYMLRRNYGWNNEELLKVYVGSIAPNNEITPDLINFEMKEAVAKTKAKVEAAGVNKIIVIEGVQDWVRGKKTHQPVNFRITPVWGKQFPLSTLVMPTFCTVTYEAGNFNTVGEFQGNGKKIADMEYFYMGERGDELREAGFPKSFTTKYCIDPDKEYDVVDISFYHADAGNHSYKSEKSIMLVSESTGSNTGAGGTKGAVATKLADDLSTALGLPDVVVKEQGGITI